MTIKKIIKVSVEVKPLYEKLDMVGGCSCSGYEKYEWINKLLNGKKAFRNQYTA